MKRLLGLTVPALALALVLGFGGAAKATISGTFNIDIYNYDALGVSANADATPGNVTTYAGELISSITYTGLLLFDTRLLPDPSTPSTIKEFLESSGGTLSSDAGLNIDLSTGGFRTTTLLDITWNGAFPGGGSIEHDDGVSLYDTSTNPDTLLTPASAATPTTPIDTTFAAIGSTDLRLIYSAANGNPEVLDVTAVPLPAAVWLFGSAILGLLGVGYKRRGKATA